MDPFFTEDIQAWFELVLLWVGFGTCVGLLAKAIMPGRDPGGAIATLLMGITGVVIGCGVYSLIYDEHLSPVSSVGLVCGTLGAFVILLFYRLLGGFLLNEAGEPPVAGRSGIWRVRPSTSLRRRRRYSHYLEE
jgi:uncharacterized membrane protein YeaQ/YmgE (transglycosylase-associated protein family)